MEARILRLEIGEEDEGKTIRQYLMKKTGFSARQVSRFKYRKDGILLNGVRRYVNAQVHPGDVLEIRLTQAGGAAEIPRDSVERADLSEGGAAEIPRSSMDRADLSEGGAVEIPRNRPEGGYLRARDGRLQKIWAAPAARLAQQHPLRILYEDADLLAADKPSGVVCHPGPGHFDDTLSNQVAEHLGFVGRELDVRVTGRLDRDTSGIVIFALNTESAALLIRQRQASMMDKLYIARVRGHFTEENREAGQAPEECSGAKAGTCRAAEMPAAGGFSGAKAGTCRAAEIPAAGGFSGAKAGTCRDAEMPAAGGFSGVKAGTVDRPLRRESSESFRMIVAADGKSARTHYEVLAELEDGTSVIACRIEQGRTHQIRVHMSSIGHPIVGDPMYGPEALEKDDGDGQQHPLMLHAYRAVLRQPFTGEEIRLEAPLPGWAAVGFPNPARDFLPGSAP